MIRDWNEITCGQINTAIKLNKKVEVILSDNVSFNPKRVKNVITEVRTTKFLDELEVRLDNAKTWTPINEFDLIMIEK